MPEFPQAAGSLLIAAVLLCITHADARGDEPPPRPAAEVLNGTVVGIIDGDSLKLKTESAVVEINLAGIDAPEMGQRGGNMAAQVLQLKVFQKTVRVLVLDHTPDGHVRGVVYLDGCVNTQHVREGIAWYDPNACQSEMLAKVEQEARQAGRGLWQHPHPVPPWQWRTAGETPRQPPEKITRHKPPADLSRLFQASSPPSRSRIAPSGYWLTEKSGVRHNNSCYYYRQSKGRWCGPGEGRPCKHCGG